MHQKKKKKFLLYNRNSMGNTVLMENHCKLGFGILEMYLSQRYPVGGSMDF